MRRKRIDNNLSYAIRRRRRNLELTQQELAARAGVSRNMIALIENNAVNPSWAVVSRILHALGCRIAISAPNERWLEDIDLLGP